MDPSGADPAGGGAAPLLALVGPTASGKTGLAVLLAERHGLDVVSVDSMQVYRGMDVGTAKPGPDELARAPHHLIDVADPPERYDARRWLEDVGRALERIARAGRRALFAGGTGFYLRALTHGLFAGPRADLDLRRELAARAAREGSPALHGELARLDPAAARRIHPNDERRVVRALEVLRQTGRTLSEWQREWRADDGGDRVGRARRLVGLEVAPEELDRRIGRRTRSMLAAGWVEEAVRVRASPGFGPTSIQALGYRECLARADGELAEAELEPLVRLRTRQFARRQRTWFRRFPDAAWIAAPAEERAGDLERAADEAGRLLGLA